MAKFQEDEFIEEIAVDSRKRTYRLIHKGKKIYMDELKGLRKCLRDGGKRCFM